MLFERSLITDSKARAVALSEESKARLREIWTRYSTDDSARVKAIERTTNHDVKAVEYFLKEKFESAGGQLQEFKEFLHFACTSEDINNLA